MSAAVLVVDDSLTVRMDLGEALEASGLEAVLCATLADARTRLARDEFALVILDVLLPDGDGLELLREIKAAPATAALPVILLSSEAEVADRIRGLRTGADEYVGKPYDAIYLAARARALVQGGAPKPEHPTILVIDDSATFREAMKGSLESAGYGVVIATSGEEGLRLAAQAVPDAVVVDGMLPGIDGPTVIRRLRSDPAFQRIPCLLLTASASDPAQDELRALEAGADAYVPKAHDPRIILARVASLLRASAGPRAATTSIFGPKKLLAVDDSPTFLQELASALRGDGYDVALARSGEEALELLTVQPVEAILLDLVMPGISGHETCRRIKRSPAWRDIPVIILTARGDPQAAIEGIDAGADDSIPKSTDFELLKARLRAQLRRRNFEAETVRFRDEMLRREREILETRKARELAEERAARSEEIRQRQEVLDFFFALSLDLLCVCDFDGRFQRLNPAWTRTLGFSEAELTATPFLDFVHPDDRAATVAEFEKILGGATTVSFENRYRCKDGSYRWLLWSAAPSVERRIVCATARDVTDRRKLEDVLRAQTIELQAQNEELKALGEELQAQQRELETQNLEVERASRLKSEFLANMSHELRTPLNAVIGFSELLLEEGRDTLTPTHVRYLEDILGSGRHLLSLINDMLDLVKIEAGRVTLELEPLAPGGCIAEAAAVIQAAAKKKAIAVEKAVKTGSLVRADTAKMRQILLNLLSNAVKFSPAGSSVEVGAEDAGELVRFWVRDRGHGIAASLLPHLFQPFVQGENPLVKRHEGTGLGLAISKRLVEQHGGTIEVASTVGAGTTFTFTIPRWTGAVPGPAPAETARAPSPPPAPSEASRRPLVVLVEDHAPSAELMRAWLAETGYQVVDARRASDALSLIERLRPSLVVLDLALDGEDGHRVLETLKAQEATRAIPVVIASARDDERRGIALGAIDYFVKPLDRTSFVRRLSEIVSPRPKNGGPKLLLIDDDPTVGTLLRPGLEEQGYRLSVATTGREGLDLARGGTFDLLIVDIMLPDISGFEVVETLASDEKTRDVPVIVLTAADLTAADRVRLAKHARALGEKGDLTRDALLAAIRRATSKTAARARRATGPKVLVVDDHDLNLELARAILERMGLAVLAAHDGESALALVRAEKPALVLMDLAMPVKDGYTACRELKADPETRGIPIVALTALAMRSDEEKARAAGFDGYVSKPIDRALLEKAVRAFLGEG
jgi:PAS domain S-box-containing protein